MTDVVPAVPTAPTGSPEPVTSEPAAPAPRSPRPAPPQPPTVSERVRALHARMTLDEKLARVGYWLDQNGTVAPMQSEMTAGQQDGSRLAEITRHGMGHYTRVYGTRPVEPAERAAWLWAEQRRLKSETRLGIPAIVHEECLTGLAAWQAATYPTPLAWGASFDPALVEEMAREVGESMRAIGVHQGLAPVLDVVRDPRWGRVDECVGEDPYLVGTVGTAYVRGLQDAGVNATLKHFVGYSGSRAGRNHAPVSAGPRQLADVYLPPFEMAVRDGGARSVMASYVDVDGVPLHGKLGAPHRDPARAVGVRRRRRRRLLRRRVPRGHAPRRGRPRGGRRAGAPGGPRRRAPDGRRLPRAARRARAVRRARRGVGRPRRPAPAQPEGGAGPARPGRVRRRAADDGRPRHPAAARDRAPPRAGVARAARERRRAAARPRPSRQR